MLFEDGRRLLNAQAFGLGVEAVDRNCHDHAHCGKEQEQAPAEGAQHAQVCLRGRSLSLNTSTCMCRACGTHPHRATQYVSGRAHTWPMTKEKNRLTNVVMDCPALRVSSGCTCMHEQHAITIRPLQSQELCRMSWTSVWQLPVNTVLRSCQSVHIYYSVQTLSTSAKSCCARYFLTAHLTAKFGSPAPQ